VPQGSAIEGREGWVIEREDGLHLREITTIEPEDLTVSDVVLSHVTPITTVIKGGIVAAKHIRDGTTDRSVRVTQSIDPAGHF
jgi:hypothetical protein